MIHWRSLMRLLLTLAGLVSIFAGAARGQFVVADGCKADTTKPVLKLWIDRVLENTQARHITLTGDSVLVEQLQHRPTLYPTNLSLGAPMTTSAWIDTVRLILPAGSRVRLVYKGTLGTTECLLWRSTDAKVVSQFLRDPESRYRAFAVTGVALTVGGDSVLKLRGVHAWKGVTAP